MSEALIKIATGQKLAVPAGWEAKAELIGLCLAAEKRCAVWPAILVEKARADFAKPEEWIAACCERFGWDKNHVHHMRGVGALVGRAQSGARTTLMECSFNVLHAMTRLPTPMIGPFCEQVDVRNLTRDQVRDHVDAWLKVTKAKKAPGKGAAPAQPDFMRELFAVGQWRPDTAARREMIASEKVRPRDPMMVGLSMLQVAVEKYTRARKVDATEIEDAIDELDTQRSLLIERLATANGGTVGMLEG